MCRTSSNHPLLLSETVNIKHQHMDIYYFTAWLSMRDWWNPIISYTSGSRLHASSSSKILYPAFPFVTLEISSSQPLNDSIGTSVGFGNVLPENLSGQCFHRSTSSFFFSFLLYRHYFSTGRKAVTVLNFCVQAWVTVRRWRLIKMV